MRKVLMVAAIAALAQAAHAADMPDYPLRGSFSEGFSSSRPLWQGFYVGGQAGQSWLRVKPPAGYNADIEAAYTVRSGIPPSIAGALPAAEGRKVAYGGFVGYNSQWEDVVVGLEANYLHSDISSTSIAYSSAGNGIQGQSSVKVALTDFGSLRLRAGYMIGSFLPYGYVGFGAGSADITRSAGVTSFIGFPIALPFETEQKNRFLYGYSAGVGVDVMLIGGLFVRAEYEFSQFTMKLNTNVNTVRAGIGYKF